MTSTCITPKKQLRRRIAMLSVALLAAGMFSVAAFISSRRIDTGAAETDSTAVSAPAVPDGAEYRKLPAKLFVFGSVHRPVETGEVFTLLICGSTDRCNADSIMLATVNFAERRAGLVSIPRDTKVYSNRALKKIGGSLGAGGMKLLLREVGEVAGYTPAHTLLFSPQGVAALVDALGGVEFDVPRDMNYDDPVQDLHIHLKAGLQTLDGDSAVQLLRFRGYPEADLARMEVQREFISAALEKLMRPITLLKIDALAEIFAENVETDLTTAEIAGFGVKLLALRPETFETATLPTYTLPLDENPSCYQFVSTKSALEVINRLVNPSGEPVTRAAVRHAPP